MGYLPSGALRVRTVTDCTVCGAISTVSVEAAGYRTMITKALCRPA